MKFIEWRVKMKVQKLIESVQYKEAENPGRGACCPTVPDYSDWIDDALAHINDAEYTKPATNQLVYCAKILLDAKQSIENFNIYWQQRYAAMIEFIDNQVERIPGDIIGSLNDVVDEGLSDRIRKGELEHTGHDDWTDVFSAEEDGVKVQFQDTVGNSYQARTKKDRWGNSYIDGIYDKHPKEFTSTWGRVWDNGKFKKDIRGPKYQVRAEMAKYLDGKK